MNKKQMVNIMLIQKVSSDACKTSEIVYWPRICDPNATYMGIEDIDFVLRVTLDRVLFQTSGFYLILFLSIINFKMINQK